MNAPEVAIIDSGGANINSIVFALERLGFTKGAANPCMLRHPDHDFRMVAHGTTILLLAWMRPLTGTLGNLRRSLKSKSEAIAAVGDRTEDMQIE